MINTGAAQVYRGNNLSPRSAQSIVALTLLLTLQLAAQSPQPASQTTAPTLRVFAREILADVTVTDAQGHPVHGLTQSDFTISEDGNPQSIRSFAEFGSGVPTTARRLPKLPPNVYTNYRATPTTGPVNLLLIDSLNVDPAVYPTLVAHAQQEVVRYLDTMPAGTQVAIFSLSSTGLHVLQGFTSDVPLLQRAMDANFLILAADPSTRPDYATLDALDKIAAYVAGIKGRKNLLWFVPTMPVLLTRDGGYAWGVSDMTRVHRTMDTFERFSAEQIAVSPIDPRGTLDPAAPKASTPPPAPGQEPTARTGAIAAAATMQANIGQGYQNLQLEAVAEDNGGVAYLENNDLSSLIATAITDGAHFYTLSYVPPRRQDDGHYHRIEITVSRPGLHLVYRPGYNAEEPKPVTPPTAQALLTASLEGQAPAATQLLFDVRIQPISESAESVESDKSADSAAPATPTARRHALPTPGKAMVPYGFLFILPHGQVAFTDGPDHTHIGSIQFDVAAFDARGKLIGNAGQTMQLPLSQAEYQQFNKTPFQLFQQIDLPPGQITLRVGVLDTVSQKIGTLEISLTVPKPKSAGAP
jgi:VWFA-related protein